MKNLQTNKPFFPHIAGLRAMAIVMVVLFHMNSSMWAHGYLGVDVFLVISGYLLFRSHDTPETESLSQSLRWLLRRICRIMTPMALVIIPTLLIGAYLLPTENEIFVSWVGYWACLVKANVYLAREMSDYFAPDGSSNPLLHLWYVSLIVQVYFIFAVLHQGIQRCPKYLGLVLWSLIGLTSLIWWCGVWGKVSYYATLPRFWEILAGGLICLLPGAGRYKWCATVISAISFLSIVIPGFTSIGAYTPLVVAGTVLFIRYLPESHLPGLLNHKIVQHLGRISFSVYLVHMPIIVFWRIWNLNALNVGDEISMFAFSIILGAAFYWLIEKRKTPLWMTLIYIFLSLMLCRTVRKENGFKKYIAIPALNYPSYTCYQICKDKSLFDGADARINYYPGVFRTIKIKNVPALEVPLLMMGNADKRPNIALIGDSFGGHAYAGLDDVFRKENLSGVYLVSPIIPIHNYKVDWKMPKGRYYNDSGKEESLMNWLAAHPELEYVIIGLRWPGWLKADAAEETDRTKNLRVYLTKLKEMGKKTILIAPTAEFNINAQLFNRINVLRKKLGVSYKATLPMSREEYLEKYKPFRDILEKMAREELCVILDPLESLAEGESFHAVLGSEILMIDNTHLSCEGSKLLFNNLRPQLRKVLNIESAQHP